MRKLLLGYGAIVVAITIALALIVAGTYNVSHTLLTPAGAVVSKHKRAPLAATVKLKPIPTATSVALARMVWHDPCGGQVTLAYRTTAQMREFGYTVDSIAIGWAIPADMGAAAHDPIAGCIVVLRSDWHFQPLEQCTVIMHEYGHLAGMPHSSNPRSVMYPSPNVPERCWQAAGIK